MPIDERRQEILKAEETVRVLAGELANHSTAAKELRSAKEAVAAVQADLNRSMKELTSEASRVSELGASLVKRTEEFKKALAGLVTKEQLKTEIEDQLSGLVTVEALKEGLAPLAKEGQVTKLGASLVKRTEEFQKALAGLVTKEQLKTEIQDQLSGLVTVEGLKDGLAPLAKEGQVTKVETNLGDQLKVLATTDALEKGLKLLATQSSIEFLRRRVMWALGVSGLAAIFGLIALMQGFLRR